MRLRKINENTIAIVFPTGFEKKFKITDEPSLSEIKMWPSGISINAEYIGNLNIYKIYVPSWSTKHIYGQILY